MCHLAELIAFPSCPSPGDIAPLPDVIPPDLSSFEAHQSDWERSALEDLRKAQAAASDVPSAPLPPPPSLKPKKQHESGPKEQQAMPSSVVDESSQGGAVVSHGDGAWDGGNPPEGWFYVPNYGWQYDPVYFRW